MGTTGSIHLRQKGVILNYAILTKDNGLVQRIEDNLCVAAGTAKRSPTKSSHFARGGRTEIQLTPRSF